MTRIGSRMKEVQYFVGYKPGHTAHWYEKNLMYLHWRMQWIYNVFFRACAANLIKAERDENGITRYYPVTN